MNLPFALVTAVAATRDNVGSARPDAPVAPHPQRSRRVRVIRAGALVLRAGLARSLVRAAHVIAPT